MLVRPAAGDEIDAGRNVSGNTVHLIVIDNERAAKKHNAHTRRL